MKYFLPISIDNFVSNIMTDDREISKIMENWNIEKDEVIKILIQHFKSLGIYTIKPLHYADMIRKNIIFQLKYNPNLKLRILQIEKEIEKVKTKHTRHAS